MLEKMECQDNFQSQELDVPCPNISLTWEDRAKSDNSMTVISPLEIETLMKMVEKLHREALISECTLPLPPLALYLEVKARSRAKALMIPVRLTNIYREVVILEAENLRSIKKPETLQGRKAILRLADPESQESLDIEGTMTLTASSGENIINLKLLMHNVQTNKPASKILENSLPFAGKDKKMLWQLWDETKAVESNPRTQKTNLFLLLLACGTVFSSFFDPKIFQTMQYLLSALGAGKIIRFIRR